MSTPGLAWSPATGTTAKARLGRSKPVRMLTGSRSRSAFTMSAETRVVAVAVSAIVAGEPSRSRTSARRR